MKFVILTEALLAATWTSSWLSEQLRQRRRLRDCKEHRRITCRGQHHE